MKRIPVLAALVLAAAAAAPGFAPTPARAAQASAHAAGAGPYRPPVVAQTSAAPGLHVLSWSVSEDDEDDTADIYGEIRNDYDVPVSFIRVDGMAFGPARTVVAQDDSYLSLDPLNPGERATFEVRLDRTGDTYGVKISRFEPSPISANRTFTISQSASKDDYGILHISGTIRNDNVEPTSVALRTTYYDEKGVAVYDGIALVNDLDDLQPGQTVPFEMTAFSPRPFASYTVVPDGIGAPSTSPSLNGVYLASSLGEEIRLTGTARPGEAVTFQKYAAGTWATVPDLMATPDESTGEFTASYTVTGPAWVRAVTISGNSAGVGVEVEASVTFKSSVSAAKKGSTVTLSGTVTPGTAGTLVTIQKKSGSRWVTLGTAKLTAAGAFVYPWRTTTKGTYVLRALVPNVGVIYGTQSASRTVKVK